MTETHPSRNTEFLSRLHDGELSPSERAHFEAHRAHCAECRRAAAEFESALSLYRSSRPAPASPDLAGRILRKLQASTPRRRFGPTFGIDVRWAGAFAAAVVAAIIGSAIVGRHEARESLARSAAPIPVVVQSKRDAANAPAAAAPPAPADAPKKAAEAPRRSAPPSRLLGKTREPGETGTAAGTGAANEESTQTAGEEKAAGGKLSVSEPERQETRADADLRRRANAKETRKAESPPLLAQRPAPPAARPVARADAAAPGAPRAQMAEAPAAAGAAGAAVPARLRIEPLDGLPEPGIAGESAGVPAALRGRSWILLIDASGRVQSVREQPSRDKRKDVAASDELRAQTPPPEIGKLRFAAGDRERRLLVRVE